MPALCMVWLNATEHFSDSKFSEAGVTPVTVISPCAEIFSFHPMSAAIGYIAYERN